MDFMAKNIDTMYEILLFAMGGACIIAFIAIVVAYVRQLFKGK